MHGYLLFSFFRIFPYLLVEQKLALARSWGALQLTFKGSVPPHVSSQISPQKNKLELPISPDKKKHGFNPPWWMFLIDTHQRFPPLKSTAPLARRPVLWASMTLKATCSSGGTFRCLFWGWAKVQKIWTKHDFFRPFFGGAMLWDVVNGVFL